MTLESYVRQYIYPGVFSYVVNSVWLWNEAAKNETIVVIHGDVKNLKHFKIVKVMPTKAEMGKDPLYVLLGKMQVKFAFGKTQRIWVEVAASFDKWQLGIWKDLNMAMN